MAAFGFMPFGASPLGLPNKTEDFALQLVLLLRMRGIDIYPLLDSRARADFRADSISPWPRTFP